KALADTAARIGVERFVLDDGWFRGRRDDSAGLGDWTVDTDVWPEGLHPLFTHVRSLGMEVGLWVEPEMVNPDSDLFRQHPDWILAPAGHTPLSSRNQQVLDLGRPEAAEYLFRRLDALITEYRPDHLKWDHNRDLLEAAHTPTGGAGTHRPTNAPYPPRERRRGHQPGLQRAPRSSRRGRGAPGSRTTHTTGRVTDLTTRCLTALTGHAGIEWDITRCTDEELDTLSRWIELYKELRPLLHTGDPVRVDEVDPSEQIDGVVARDGS